MSLRAGGRAGNFPRLLLLENRRKIEPKEIPSCLIPLLLVVFTRQLEILVTTLIVLFPLPYFSNKAKLSSYQALDGRLIEVTTTELFLGWTCMIEVAA